MSGNEHKMDPWDMMQEHDVERFGAIIRDREEQVRWCRAIFLGGLPYMWRKAAPVRDMMYDRMELKPGDRVFLIGESLESCGFISDIRERIGSTGEIESVDITDQARDAAMSGRRGSTGMLATWNWDYTLGFADETFDCVACLQGVQHTEDWRVTGRELLRILKPRRRFVTGEIALGSPDLNMKIELDLHIEYLYDKVFSRIGFDRYDIPYWGPRDLMKAFDGIVDGAETFVWKGVELFWARKP